jgi:hypothetical protein
MRRSSMALLGLITAVGAALAPAAVQASTPPTASAATGHQANAGPGMLTFPTSGTSHIRTTHITLPPAQCTALRRSMHNRAGSCSVVETLHLTAVSRPTLGERGVSANPTSYWYGYLRACADPYTSGPYAGYCNTNDWWAQEYFNVTTNGVGAWDNGIPSCSADHTNITWCGYTNNGQNPMSVGFNFGNGGWARAYIYADGVEQGDGASWAHECGVYSRAPLAQSPVC